VIANKENWVFSRTVECIFFGTYFLYQTPTVTDQVLVISLKTAASPILAVLDLLAKSHFPKVS
jgi:hypothetical protein